MTVAEALREATQRLGASSDTARLDAEYLMAHALGVSRSDLLLHCQGAGTPDGFDAMLRRRIHGEPLAHITGEQEFFGRGFIVTPDVLIPRSDSEQVVEAALGELADGGRILDLGTGSGALLVTLLAERARSAGIGIEASLAALPVAAANAARHGVADRARMLRADWNAAGWASDLGKFDLVIANPPYIEADAVLDRSVRAFEPPAALFAGPEGLDAYRAIVPQLSSLLSPGGVAVLEIGYRQADAVGAIAGEYGYESILKRDLAERPRTLILRR